jgi:uncharacterized lipoprotein YbaY
MRLIRSVAIALVAMVSVASLGCDSAEKKAPAKADTEMSATSTPATSSETGETATAGLTQVSMTITGMK